jgi:hypothetical protein
MSPNDDESSLSPVRFTNQKTQNIVKQHTHLSVESERFIDDDGGLSFAATIDDVDTGVVFDVTVLTIGIATAVDFTAILLATSDSFCCCCCCCCCCC